MRPNTSRNRRAGDKRRMNDAALLFSRTMNPFRRAAGCNLNRLAHMAIVGHAVLSVYTARPGRLPRLTENEGSNTVFGGMLSGTCSLCPRSLRRV